MKAELSDTEVEVTKTETQQMMTIILSEREILGLYRELASSRHATQLSSYTAGLVQQMNDLGVGRW